MDIQKIISRFEKLKEARTAKEDTWKEIEKYCISGARPYGATNYKTGTKQYIYDGTAMQASEILASGLFSSLTNPASKWFILSSDDSYTTTEKQYVADLAEFARYVLFNSNFYINVATFYSDLIHYGISCMYEETDTNDLLNFSIISPHSFVFDEDQWGKVKTVMVEFKLTAIEAFEQFKDAVSEEIKKAVDKNPYKEFEFLQVTGKKDSMPNIGKKLVSKKDMPYYSYYIELKQKKIVKEDAYKTFPYFIVKWKRFSNELYGSSPSMSALPDVKMVNSMVHSYIINAEKLTNPPLSLPYEGYLGDINLSPGGLNYRLTSNPQDKIEPIITSGNMNINAESISEVRQAINKAYFVDLFLMNKDTTMTATEVIQRSQEKMLLLGSLVGRMLHEFLTPLIRRTIAIISDSSIFPNPPSDMDLNSFDIKYLSPLAQSQQSAEYNSMVVLLNTALQVMQFNPDVGDIINWDEFVNKVADIYAVSPKVLNDDDTIKQLRQQRAQVQQIQTQLALKEQAGKADKQEAQANLTQKKAEGV